MTIGEADALERDGLTKSIQDPSDTKASSRSIERWLPYAVAIAIALPTLLSYYPPMTDLPMHESVIGVMLHLRDTAYFPRDVYELNLGHPNQLFHILSWFFALAVDTRWAIKLVIALAQVAIFHAGVGLADHLGRSRWGVMLLAPLALGFTYYWGLVANLIGFAAFLYALPIIDNMIVRPRWRAVMGTSALMLVLYLAHESSFMMAAGVVVLFTLSMPFDRRLTPIRLVPAGFATAVGLGHLAWQTRNFTADALHVAPSWFSLWNKIKYFPNALVGSHELRAQLLLLGLGITGAAALLVARWTQDSSTTSNRDGLLIRSRTNLRRYRFEALAGIYLVLYFAMPFNWNGVTLLHERFLGPAWGIFVLCASPRGRTPRLAKFAGSVMPFGILLTAWPQFADASRTYESLDRVLRQIPKGSAVAVCVLDSKIINARVYAAGPGPARSVAVVGGRGSLSLMGSPISPIQVRRPYRWDEYALRVFVWGSRAFIPTHDFQRWEYVVGVSRFERNRKKLTAAFAPEADLIASDGEWLLFRSKSPSLPLDALDARPPREALGDTVFHRVLAMDRKALAELTEDDANHPPIFLPPASSAPPVAAPPADAGMTE